MIFPTVTGENLEGKKFTLPTDLEGEHYIVFIPFERWQQTEVDSWSPLMQQLTQEYLTQKYYEVPTLSTGNLLSRWFINNGMRSGIPDKNVRRVTITLYLDKQPFRKVLNMPNEEHTHVLLVQRNGEIRWRTQGTWDAEKERELRAVLTN